MPLHYEVVSHSHLVYVVLNVHARGTLSLRAITHTCFSWCAVMDLAALFGASSCSLFRRSFSLAAWVARACTISAVLTPHAPTPSSVRAALCARDNVAHVMLAALAALYGTRAGELYGRLRANYNAHRPPGSPPAPPLEEWRGLSTFCEDLHCRWVLVGCPSSNGLSIEGFDAGTVHHAYRSPTDPKLW